MKICSLTVLIVSCFFLSCKNNDTKFQNKGHELVYAMVQKVGNYSAIQDKENVIYTYTYQTPDNETDVSTEKYIFDGELSYGAYSKHERTLPQLEGLIEQGFDGKEYWLKHNGNVLTDESLLKKVKFNRPTNFYWFTMMQKLLDPGLIYEHLGEKMIGTQNYDIVKITFDSEKDKITDIYQLYINKSTLLVDQFLFTVADFGVLETPFLMTLKYEEIDGILLPTQRLYKKSTWNADVSVSPWTKVTWTNIKFNNDLDIENFKKEGDMIK